MNTRDRIDLLRKEFGHAEPLTGKHGTLQCPDCHDDFPDSPSYWIHECRADVGGRRDYDQKASNPKDEIGSTKLPMHLTPSTVEVLASLAFLEGALKYGKYNWRIAGVRFCIYLDAMKRHINKLLNGEWADPKTKVPHLASIIACAGIIEDARLAGKLTDDRPPRSPMSEYIDEQVDAVAHLKDLFKDHNPRHYTIHDSEQKAPSPDPAPARPEPRPVRTPKGKTTRARGKAVRRGKTRRR